MASEVDARRLNDGEDLEFSLMAGERALTIEGNLQESRRWFDAAYRAAEVLADGQAMARAAVGLGGVWVHEHRTAAETVVVLTRQRHALTLVDPESVLSLRLRIRLAGEQAYREGGHGR